MDPSAQGAELDVLSLLTQENSPGEHHFLPDAGPATPQPQIPTPQSLSTSIRAEPGADTDSACAFVQDNFGRAKFLGKVML